MKKLFLSMLCGALLAFTANYCQAQKQPFELVNLFIGTGEGGNMYPGAQAPFGMISISPESVFKDYDDASARSGYKYAATEIKGFGLTHFSGVGCHAMQDLQFLPVSGQIEQSPVNHKGYYKSSFTHTGEKASPGFYSVKLEDYGINAKFTVTQRAGISEITYNSDKAAGFIFQPTNSANGISAGQITINKSKRQLSGYITTGGFCWRDPKLQPYTVYFVMQFDAEFTAHGVWKGQAKNVGRDTVSGNDIAAYLNFNIKKGQMVRMKTALSFVSVANAIQNLRAEISGGNFDATWQKTRAQWQKYFNKITVKGGSANETAMFYTGIYHNLLQPNVFNDVNGQYTGFDFKVHKIEKGRDKYVNFSLWDTYRTTAQLQAILAPEQASDMVQSLLLDAQQGGAFPNWSMNNQEYGVMNGYSTFPFIANTYAFGARNFDLKAVKDMMKKVSENYYGCQGRHGWGNLADYKKYKYVPVDKNGYGTSMTLEYGIDDYSIAKICQAAGDTDASKYYLHRSQNAFSLFNPHSGFIQGRKTDGLFINNYSDTSQTGFNEGNAAQYFWSIPHSTVKLIDAAGGNIAVEKRLDNFISTIEVGWAPEKPHYWLANEPCFGAVYVYNYLQVPQKAQYNVRRIINDYFKNTPDGMPGDDDAGSMSALYVFSVMGLYPYLPGEGGFMVTGPLFSGITINLKNGKKISINAKGAATNAPYIQQMLLNGKPTNNLWLNWDVINKGSNINFIMAQKQSTWGSAKKDLPPSYNPENDQ